jgi:hypothetical protein
LVSAEKEMQKKCEKWGFTIKDMKNIKGITTKLLLTTGFTD